MLDSEFDWLQAITLAHANGQEKPSSIWSDRGNISPDLPQGHVFHAVEREFKHGTKPIEFHPKPGSLLWNRMLTHLAPRDIKILVDFHMPNDVELWILVDFNEISAWKLAHWTLP